MINQLINSTGDFRRTLGLQDANSVVDLSCDNWDSRFEVIRGVDFHRARLVGKRVAVDFVECNFSECEFMSLESRGHFSGAGNTWARCKFDDIVLSDLIAPQSTFIGCEFTRVHIHGFRLCQTAFEHCSFRGVTIDGLAARRIGDQLSHLQSVPSISGSALFSCCAFSDTVFKGSSFAGVCFEGCIVDRTRFDHCSFAGILGKDAWWKQFDSSDPFVAFLEAVLNGVEVRLGPASRAYRVLRLYIESYMRGETKSRDYSACLYTGEVPDDELDAVQDILDAAESAFPI